MDNQFLVKLCSRTWALTSLRLIAQGTSARVSPLAAAAGCGRTAMSASVAHLIELGLLEKNPGYGHPMRPEFRLTAAGEAVAAWAADLYSMVDGEHDRSILRGKWSLPLLSCLPQQTRYSELRRELAPVSDRALSNCLGQLTERNWVARVVSTDTSPPSVSYCAIDAGLILHRQLRQLPVVA
jgi:DNA-binding HxlR family transcriptional regulator